MEEYIKLKDIKKLPSIGGMDGNLLRWESVLELPKYELEEYPKSAPKSIYECLHAIINYCETQRNHSSCSGCPFWNGLSCGIEYPYQFDLYEGGISERSSILFSEKPI